MVSKVTMYVDGSCLGNPGPGGWGCILTYKDKEKIICGSNKLTTNNQMELTAAIEGLRVLKKQSVVDIFTDSKYVQNGITSWIFGWKKTIGRTLKEKK